MNDISMIQNLTEITDTLYTALLDYSKITDALVNSDFSLNSNDEDSDFELVSTLEELVDSRSDALTQIKIAYNALNSLLNSLSSALPKEDAMMYFQLFDVSSSVSPRPESLHPIACSLPQKISEMHKIQLDLSKKDNILTDKFDSLSKNLKDKLKNLKSDKMKIDYIHSMGATGKHGGQFSESI